MAYFTYPQRGRPNDFPKNRGSRGDGEHVPSARILAAFVHPPKEPTRLGQLTADLTFTAERRRDRTEAEQRIFCASRRAKTRGAARDPWRVLRHSRPYANVVPRGLRLEGCAHDRGRARCRGRHSFRTIATGVSGLHRSASGVLAIHRVLSLTLSSSSPSPSGPASALVAGFRAGRSAWLAGFALPRHFPPWRASPVLGAWLGHLAREARRHLTSQAGVTL